MMRRYAECRPADLDSHNTLVVQPWGALEWHGDHCPLGLDGIVAEHFANLLATKHGGLVMPTQWNAMTTLPHKSSLQVSTELFRNLVRETLAGLQQSGFKTICVVTGHYAQGHMIELYRAASELTDFGSRVFVATPLEPLGKAELLDHAGLWEVSQLLAIEPELVQLESLVDDPSPRVSGVLGEKPVSASAEAGRMILSQALEAWTTWIETATETSLAEHYAQAELQYQPYVEAYLKSSWEQAIKDWWATK